MTFAVVTWSWSHRFVAGPIAALQPHGFFIKEDFADKGLHDYKVGTACYGELWSDVGGCRLQKSHFGEKAARPAGQPSPQAGSTGKPAPQAPRALPPGTPGKVLWTGRAAQGGRGVVQVLPDLGEVLQILHSSSHGVV